MFGNGLKANVARDGRLINVFGSPVAGLTDARLGTPTISADFARRRAAADLKVSPRTATASRPTGATRTTTFSNGDRALLVIFQTVGGPRLAWQTLGFPDGQRLFLQIVDAKNGRVMFGISLTDADNDLAWDTGRMPQGWPATGPQPDWARMAPAEFTATSAVTTNVYGVG
ncbi:hypothetical protein ACQP2F_15305 [Actinoplanes sp. CA-030573]|uniref:hypothetical protein n=1 Tax=Actinoplanes sp. CA-030573 TaxID=3239898 RepID=UPI003D92A4AA